VEENKMNSNQSPVDLADLDLIDINPDLPQKERILEFVRQIKDPYLFRCGKYTIRSSFRKDGSAFEDVVIGMRAN
jgi:hypothetical protein